ncbi:hypothetical protein HOY80DRAFT_888130, partial [Tuber brumale]
QTYRAFETRDCEFLTFPKLDPTMSPEILHNLLYPGDTDTLGLRIHFIAPDHYLGVVMPFHLHETSISWMRNECIIWVYSRLLTPTASISIADALISMSLCSIVWDYWVYANNRVAHEPLLVALRAHPRHSPH